MSIVKSFNKKTGITYVYESESYWDPVKKQPRNHRKLIGKLDDNGEIVPTGKNVVRNDLPISSDEAKELRAAADTADAYRKDYLEARKEVYELKEQIKKLEKEKQEILEGIESLLQKHSK